MRYCPKCDTEYRDDVQVCSDDGTKLLSKAEYEAVVARAGNEPIDQTRLTTVLSLADRFEADELVEALREEGLNVSLVNDDTRPFPRTVPPNPVAFSIRVPEAE